MDQSRCCEHFMLKCGQSPWNNTRNYTHSKWDEIIKLKIEGLSNQFEKCGTVFWTFFRYFQAAGAEF